MKCGQWDKNKKEYKDTHSLIQLWVWGSTLC
jgi:hypothetical protein